METTPLMQGYYYRKHAVRVRQLAAETTTPDVKEHLHDVAREYDALADRADDAARISARSP